MNYINAERVRKNKKGKTIIHDVMCKTVSGHRFIVEMQKGKKDDFLERSVYYTCRGVTDQISISTGNLDSSFKYMPVASVFMCNFNIRQLEEKLVSHFMLRDTESGWTLNSGVRTVYVQLPRFEKEWEECDSNFDKWIYLLKNMYRLKEFPEVSRKDEVFSRLERVASYAELSDEEKIAYEADLRWAGEYDEELATAKREAAEEGRAEGLVEGRAEGILAEKWETARLLSEKGMDVGFISEVTGLKESELKAKLKI